MPDEDKTFSGSLVLDLRIWWRQVYTLCKQLVGINRYVKGFDSMHLTLLLSKLRAYGFEENFINLFCSYLCERSNRVKLASRKSSWKRVNRGCPQGSELGPKATPWNIFQNDLKWCYDENWHISKPFWNINKKTSWAEKCCLLFSNISFRSSDIQVFKIVFKILGSYSHSL